MHDLAQPMRGVHVARPMRGVHALARPMRGVHEKSHANRVSYLSHSSIVAHYPNDFIDYS